MTAGKHTLVQVMHLARLGGSPFLGMFERPCGCRNIACDRPLMRSFVRYSTGTAPQYRTEGKAS